MEKTRYLKIPGRKVEDRGLLLTDSEDPRANMRFERANTLFMARHTRDVARMVNAYANTDHQRLKLFPMADFRGQKEFHEYDGPGAKIGYAFDSASGEIVYAFGGDINVDIARQALEMEGLGVVEVDGFPTMSMPNPRRTNDGSGYYDTSDSSGSILDYRATIEELAEREEIERRHDPDSMVAISGK